MDTPIVDTTQDCRAEAITVAWDRCDAEYVVRAADGRRLFGASYRPIAEHVADGFRGDAAERRS